MKNSHSLYIKDQILLRAKELNCYQTSQKTKSKTPNQNNIRSKTIMKEYFFKTQRKNMWIKGIYNQAVSQGHKNLKTSNFKHARDFALIRP